MPTTPDFTGLWIPLITPFHQGAVDHPALTRLVKQLAHEDVTGFVACGSTGEAAALDKAEQLAVLDTVLAANTGLPVVMGLSGYHMEHTLAWVKTLCQHPIAGLLVPAPHYIRPSQAGLQHWFTALADSATQPLIIYDIPYRTGSHLTLETLLALAAHPNIRAIKDCGGDANKTQALINDGRLQVLAGEDAQILATLSMGGVGAITASAHLKTAQFVQVLAAMRQGDLAQAQALWQALPALVQAVFTEPNPALIKAALAHQGLIHNELRLPMMPASMTAEKHLLYLLNQVNSAA
jgi:4-hydroxy-tetrahydrodipicolinate synthase